MDSTKEFREPLRGLNLSVIATSLLVFSFSLLQGGKVQLLLLPMLLCAGIVLALAAPNQSVPNPVDQLIALTALAVVVGAATTRIPNSGYPGLWAGFGAVPAATALACAVSLSFGPTFTPLTSRFRSLSVTLVYFLVPVGLIVPNLLLFIQPSHGLINLGDTTYHVLDELLAPYTGGFPYGNYTPQYTGVLGWLLVPAQLLSLKSETVMTVTIAMTNLLNLSVPLFVVAISRLAFPRLRRVTVFCAFVALWTVCGTDLGYSTQVREFSHFARYVPSLFAIWLALQSVRQHSAQHRKLWQLAAGCGLAIATLNSADYGLTLAVSVFLALALIAYRKLIRWSLIVQLGSYFLFVVMLVVVISMIIRQPISIQSFLGLRTDALAGSVYGTNKQINPFGPQVLVMMFPVMLTVLIFSKRPPWRTSTESLRVELLATTTAIWLTLLMVKFIVKDPGGAVELPPNFVAVFLGGVVICCSVVAPFARQRPSALRIQILPLLFIFCLIIGVVYPSANISVRDELKRISGRHLNTNNWSMTPGRNSDGWSPEALVVEDNLLVEVRQRVSKYGQDGRDIGYFGAFGNTVELVTGVNNITGIAAPESLRFGGGQEVLACKPAANAEPDLVIVYNTDFPCPGFTADPTTFNGKFRIYRRDG